jgi:hypothetical protein
MAEVRASRVARVREEEAKRWRALPCAHGREDKAPRHGVGDDRR